MHNGRRNARGMEGMPVATEYNASGGVPSIETVGSEVGGNPPAIVTPSQLHSHSDAVLSEGSAPPDTQSHENKEGRRHAAAYMCAYDN
jgi:hypothetical protein